MYHFSIVIPPMHCFMISFFNLTIIVINGSKTTNFCLGVSCLWHMAIIYLHLRIILINRLNTCKLRCYHFFTSSFPHIYFTDLCLCLLFLCEVL